MCFLYTFLYGTVAKLVKYIQKLERVALNTMHSTLVQQTHSHIPVHTDINVHQNKSGIKFLNICSLLQLLQPKHKHQYTSNKCEQSKCYKQARVFVSSFANSRFFSCCYACSFFINLLDFFLSSIFIYFYEYFFFISFHSYA